MAILTKAPRGTQDLLPAGSYRTRYIENSLLTTAYRYGFRELRTPVFEHTELFRRGVGEGTDVVQKEMYTFNDNGGRSVTLRPEGTAGAVRAFIEHGLFNEPLPLKVFYLTSCYRYEKPQAGRLREFHQFGVEVFGSAGAAQDAEIIALAQNIFDDLGVSGLRLELNSIGCKNCRPLYRAALTEYFESRSGCLCDTCKGRLHTNPMRILDCKNPPCKEVAAGAPHVTDFLCEDCRAHFDEVQKRLDALDIPYTVNPTIVRGLDYYTRTVFEFVSGDLGAQSTVLGGGRYDGLAAELGGPDTPACGFACGLERLELILDAQGVQLPSEPAPDVYIASMTPEAGVKAAVLAAEARDEGLIAVCDTMGRSLKAQMKYAGKLGALYTLVLGGSELESGEAKLKKMADGTEYGVSLDRFAETLVELELNDIMD